MTPKTDDDNRTIPTRPPVIDRYKEITKTIADLTKEQKQLRPEVEAIVREADWDDCYMQVSVKSTFNEEVALSWIKQSYPELLDKVSKVSLDFEKFGKLCKLGEIDTSTIPGNFFHETTSYSLITNRPRKAKNESEDSNEVSQYEG